MKRIAHIYRNGIILLSLGFLFNACSSTTKKPVLHTVEIKDMQFVPNVLNVQKGDTVMWINQDMVAHDVTEETTKAWASPPLVSGESWKMVVTADADYYCSIHVVMKGQLKIQ